MTLIQIDGFELHPSKRIIQLLLDLCRGESMIGLVADREEQLGCDQIPIAWIPPQGIADKSFCFPGAILIGSIEQIDSGFESCLDAADGPLSLDTASDCEPSAEAQLGNYKRAVAKPTLKHFQ